MVTLEQPLRILQVVASYAPGWCYGGPTRVAYELSQALHRRGHHVTVYTTDAFLTKSLRRPMEQTHEQGIRVVRFRNINRRLAERSRLFTMNTSGSFIQRQIKGFDVLHLHEHRMFYNILLRHEAKRNRVSFFLTTHGTATFNGQREHAKRIFDKIIGRHILRDAAALFALTSTEAAELQALAGTTRPIITIPNGVQIPQIESATAIAAQRQKWGVAEGKQIILYFGRIARSKRIDLLLKAVALGTDLDSAHVVICGPDDGASVNLQKLAQQLGIATRTTFAEPIYDNQKHIALQSADVIVVPTFTGLPMVLLEAAANSRPAITVTDTSALPWFDGKGGLVSDAEPLALAKALHTVLNAQVGREMGKAARLIVESAFSWDAIAASYEQHYRQYSKAFY